MGGTQRLFLTTSSLLLETGTKLVWEEAAACTPSSHPGLLILWEETQYSDSIQYSNSGWARGRRSGHVTAHGLKQNKGIHVSNNSLLLDKPVKLLSFMSLLCHMV